MEVVGIGLAIPGVIDLLLKTALSGYKVFSSVQSHGSQLGQHQWHLDRQRERFEEWTTQLRNNSGSTSALFASETRRGQFILETLVRIAAVFAEADQLESKYGIKRSTSPENARRIRSASPAPSIRSTRSENGKSGSRRAKIRHKVMGLLGKESTHARSSSDLLQVPPTLSPEPSPFMNFSVATLELQSTGISVESIRRTDLDSNVDPADPKRNYLQKLAQQYQSNLSAYSHVEWEVCGRNNLQALIDDLKEYNDALVELTKNLFQICKCLSSTDLIPLTAL
jgi:hypothetical protein